ncbi:MAG: hypothetical protein IIX96_01770, partial [Clostridia bacterium]|nr:hypothetical protein [Clostridia bacterium]
MEEKEIRSKDIEDIIKSADNAEVTAEDNGSLKFEFFDGGSLVFETLTKEESEIDTILKSEGKTDLKITNDEQAEEAKKPKEAETSLPDVFSVSEAEEKKE